MATLTFDLSLQRYCRRGSRLSEKLLVPLFDGSARYVAFIQLLFGAWLSDSKIRVSISLSRESTYSLDIYKGYLQSVCSHDVPRRNTTYKVSSYLDDTHPL